MQFSTLALSALLGLASAQTTSVTVVQVARNNNSLTFAPDNIKVAAGGFVQFQFLAGNHTVTQSNFDNPCQPISAFSNVTGFHSGFVPAAPSLKEGNVPTYTVQINNTNPIWLYCAQGKHCQAGMSMVINENTAKNATRSLTEYRNLALKATTGVPGTSSSGGSAGTTTSSGGSSSSGSSSGSTTSSSSSSTATSVTTSDSSLLAVPKIAAGLVAVAGSFFLL